MLSTDVKFSVHAFLLIWLQYCICREIFTHCIVLVCFFFSHVFSEVRGVCVCAKIAPCSRLHSQGDVEDIKNGNERA